MEPGRERFSREWGRPKGDIQDFALRGDILDVTFHRFGLARRLGLQCTLNPRGWPTKKGKS
jgi:hypothetical protein